MWTPLSPQRIVKSIKLTITLSYPELALDAMTERLISTASMDKTNNWIVYCSHLMHCYSLLYNTLSFLLVLWETVEILAERRYSWINSQDISNNNNLKPFRCCSEWLILTYTCFVKHNKRVFHTHRGNLILTVSSRRLLNDKFYTCSTN